MSFSSSSSPEITPACRADSPQHEYEYKTQEDVLEDLSSRFILNLPEEELTSLERISFQIEQAHWFYEDFIREQNPKFPSLPLKKFSAMLFEQCPMLHHFKADHDQAFHNFMLYKTRVPVCGAIMLNETWEKCLLVKGWKSSSGWGFPKGKINEDEPQSSCAVREVLEETGYNLAGQVNPADVIEMVIKEQKIVLYIVPGVPEDFPFKTKTRKEISKIEWFKLTDLPTWKRQKAAAGKFYLITPFIGALKAWINEKKHTARPRKHPRSKRANAHGRSRQNSVSDYPYHPAQDVLQESSSQSSSADNGEPETPSPEHPQAVANHVNVSTEVLDPHFARLLSSLALSGQATQKKDKPIHSVVPEGEGPPERNTPVPAVPLVKPQHQLTKSRPPTTQPPKAQPPALQSPKPQPLLSETEQPNGLNFGKEMSRPVVSPLQAKSVAYQLSPSPATSLPDPPHSARKSSISTASTSSPTAPTASPRVSRRTSSVADISPYLSKAPEIPASAKRWKELALLEAVADESARMTNFIRNAPTPSPSLSMMAPSLPMPYSMQGQGPMSVPPPSASVPPHQFQGRMDAGTLYSSPQTMRPGTSLPPLPPITNMPNVPLPYSQFDDPFKVRPRTSQAVNRAYPPMGPSSMSMTQNQLASLMNLPQGVPNLPPHPAPIPLPLNASYRFPPNPAINPVLSMAGPAPQRQGPFPLPVHPQPLSVIPPGGSFTPGPLSAPAISPRFDMMPNNPLLSILNGNNQGLSGASITRPM